MTPDDTINQGALERLRVAGVWHDEPEVLRFLAAVAAANPYPSRVVELGAHRMHDHDPRPTFPDAGWTGVDWRDGPGVFVVGLAHEVVTSRYIGKLLVPVDVDVVLSISALEHDPHWALTVAAAVALVRPGGLVAVTCAGPGWEEHERDCAPGGPYYRNVDCEEVASTIRLAAVARCLRVSAIRSWYEERTCAPHWPRTCVLARIG